MVHNYVMFGHYQKIEGEIRFKGSRLSPCSLYVKNEDCFFFKIGKKVSLITLRTGPKFVP